MATTPTVYTGSDAEIQLGLKGESGKTHSVLAISDFSLTLDRGTVEQELVGETGNIFFQGALSIDGSLTSCKLASGATGFLLESIISGTSGKRVWVSGSCGAKSLHFFFASCQITGFDITIGDASTITEGSIDFTVLNPSDVTKTTIGDGGIWIKA